MKERHNYRLMAETGNNERGYERPELVDFVRLDFRIDGVDNYFFCHPSRVEWNKENYPKQIQREVEWT